MRMVLFQIFGIKVYSYGLMIAIGIIVAGLMFLRKGKEKGYDEDKLTNLMILAVVSGIVGGKLLFILVNIKEIMKDKSLLYNLGEGFVVYGAIILGTLSVYIYTRKKKWDFLSVMDCIMPGLAIAQGFGRIGCFLAGCCYGKATDLFMGVTFPVDSLAPSGIALHPTQLYSSVFDFILGAFLIIYSRNKNAKNGKLTSAYVIFYSIGRFIVEFLRDDKRGALWIFSTSQWIAIGTLILGIILFVWVNKKGRVDNIEAV